LTVTPGRPEPLGVTLAWDGINVAVCSAHATAIELCLFEADGEGPARETARILLTERTGDVFHAHVSGPGIGQLYGLRAHGPFDPARGHRFNPAKLLVDPYATRLDSPFKLHPAQFSHRLGELDADLTCDDVDSAPFVPKAIVEESHWPSLAAREKPAWDRKVVYELHVKGFTQLHPAIPDAIRGTFAGLADPAAVGHLKSLGVTTVELMPAMAWIEERHLLPPLGLTNAWGYNPVALLAPDPRLAPGGWPEVRKAVSALQDAGMEVILDVVLNHTGEGDQLGPTLSFRGLDNALYYRLRPGGERHYIDDAGCGNILALDRPPVLRLAMEALRTWVVRGGLDGFRFDLAATLGRRADGFDAAAPLLSAIAQDPVLRDLTLIAEPWDIGPGGYQAGQFPATWAEWNDRYRDDVRRFWRGDGFMLGALATRLAGSQDLFAAKRRPSRSLNYVIAHDGFTLADLVSYAGKHNEANGEHNRDGTDANASWNHGVEGPSTDPGVSEARLRDQRALLATLLVSRGTPMLAMGMEAGRSQDGNNNAYAQDNALNWMNWSGIDEDLVAFTAAAVKLRREHPALRADRFLSGEPGEAGLPDVEWLNGTGQPMSEEDWNDGGGTLVVSVLSARHEQDGETDRVSVVLHRGWDRRDLVLPWARPGYGWRLALDSANNGAGGDGLPENGLPETGLLEGESRIEISARTVLAFVEENHRDAARASGAASALLDRLAQAAGIAPDWWDETGGHHAVSDETRRALLSAMDIPAGSTAEVAGALERFADERSFRALPHTLTCLEGDVPRIPIPERFTGARLDLVLRLESGEESSLRLDPHQAARRPFEAADRRSGVALIFELPPLPVGLHSLRLESRPETACQLIVAPRRCWRPPALAEGRRAFGIGAHLYALRSFGDQGVGDFRTLRELGESAARMGAVTVGLNPLHALFAGDRDRASPYHPSDRRFLDPIYIDLSGMGALSGSGDANPSEFGLSRLAGQIRAAERFEEARAIDYPAVWKLKSDVLEEAFAGFKLAGQGSAAADAFSAFRRRGGEALERFAIFEALAEANPGPWFAWPQRLRDPSSPAVRAEAPAERVAYHAWLQWLADRQLAETDRASRAAGLSLGFYRDLAVGAAPDGAETWSSPGVFARGASIGAPPDLFSSEGQVWNLPPPNPLVQQEGAGAAFAELLSANMRHAGLLRIDHVMALTRLFWVPDGARGREGAYVAAPLDTLLARLTLESRRAEVAVVGEDLGTVPDGLRERLEEADVLSYRVLWFERDGVGFKPPESWPAAAAACVSTHDLPTLSGWWIGADIAEKRALGLLNKEAEAAAAVHRRSEKGVLVSELLRRGLLEAQPDAESPMNDALANAIHAYVSASPSCLMLAQADDLAGEVEAVNLPGTDRERPNWRRRLASTVEQLMDSERGKSIAGALKDRRMAL
jgi:glycogen operon protein